MVRTRRKVKEDGDVIASPPKRARFSDSPSDTEDELAQPSKAIRGKNGRALKQLFHAFLDAVDESALPYFKSQLNKVDEAFEEFARFLNEIFRRDDFIDENSDIPDAEFEDDEDDEEELEEEETTDGDEDVDDLLEEDSENGEAVTDEEEEQYDDDEVEYIDEEEVDGDDDGYDEEEQEEEEEGEYEEYEEEEEQSEHEEEEEEN